MGNSFFPSSFGRGDSAGPGSLCASPTTSLGPGSQAGALLPHAGGEPGLALAVPLGLTPSPAASDGEEMLQLLKAAWGSARLSPHHCSPYQGLLMAWPGSASAAGPTP